MNDPQKGYKSFRIKNACHGGSDYFNVIRTENFSLESKKLS